MTKITVEHDGLRVEAVSVSPKGVADIIRIIFAESVSAEDQKAETIREKCRRKEIDKIPAIKLVRELFLGSADWRGSLKGAKDYIEGANHPTEDL